MYRKVYNPGCVIKTCFTTTPLPVWPLVFFFFTKCLSIDKICIYSICCQRKVSLTSIVVQGAKFANVQGRGKGAAVAPATAAQSWDFKVTPPTTAERPINKTKHHNDNAYTFGVVGDDGIVGGDEILDSKQLDILSTYLQYRWVQ